MGYDLQSQMWDQLDPCLARPNAPADKIQIGLESYLDIGIEPSKLILGTPWYGYDYECISFDGRTCEIEHTLWRGCNCSDFVGTQKSYDTMLNLLANDAVDGRQWDEASQTPYFSYQNENGTWHQVWYDDPESLAIKYGVARDALAIRGVGMWNADHLDYTDDQQVEDMWGAFPSP